MSQIKDTTIYFYQMSNNGASYETPKKETWEHLKERKGYATEQELIDYLNGWGGDYFIGTQAEYDGLVESYKYYSLPDDTTIYRQNYFPLNNLVDGKMVYTFKDNVLPQFPKAVEKTKAEYDVWKVQNDKDLAFALKVSELISISSPKLAAYIAKCEDYIAEHVDDLKAPQLQSFILKNGKIDEVALETAIKANQDKSDSIALLCEAYLSWIVLIEKGTQAGLDELPETDPTKLNAIIDALWKAEHDKERKALIAKLNSSEAEFAIVDKYLVVTQGDEPEIK